MQRRKFFLVEPLLQGTLPHRSFRRGFMQLFSFLSICLGWLLLLSYFSSRSRESQRIAAQDPAITVLTPTANTLKLVQPVTVVKSLQSPRISTPTEARLSQAEPAPESGSGSAPGRTRPGLGLASRRFRHDEASATETLGFGRHVSRREFAFLASTASLVAVAAAVDVAIPRAAQALVSTLPYQKQPGLTLNTGQQFPFASFGLQETRDDTARNLTTIALKQGFRNFYAPITAGNQRGFALAIKESGIPREEIFICGSVASESATGFAAAKNKTALGCANNMKNFAVGGIDYLDMIMLEAPGPDEESIKGQWSALEEFKSSQQTRALAVSNFKSQQIDIAKSVNGITPAINQIPYGVGFADVYKDVGGLVKFADERIRSRGVQVQAYSSLSVFRNPLVKGNCSAIGEKYGKTGAQVALRWVVQTGASFTTFTKFEERLAEDIDIFDFELTPEDMDKLGDLYVRPPARAPKATDNRGWNFG